MPLLYRPTNWMALLAASQTNLSQFVTGFLHVWIRTTGNRHPSIHYMNYFISVSVAHITQSYTCNHSLLTNYML